MIISICVFIVNSTVFLNLHLKIYDAEMLRSNEFKYFTLIFTLIIGFISAFYFIKDLFKKCKSKISDGGLHEISFREFGESIKQNCEA